jgi:hypothetical protein
MADGDAKACFANRVRLAVPEWLGSAVAWLSRRGPASGMGMGLRSALPVAQRAFGRAFAAIFCGRRIQDRKRSYRSGGASWPFVVISRRASYIWADM